MIEFDQYLGFIAFLTILTIGFWLMIFLLTFVTPYWITGSLIEFLKEKRKAKNETLLEKSYKRNVAEGLQNLKCRKQS